MLDLGEVMNKFPAQLPIPREKITQGAVVITESHQLVNVCSCVCWSFEQMAVALMQDVNDLSLSPDGNVLATAGSDGLVKFWKLNMDSDQGPV